jgi:N-methylhydantoinase A
MRVAFDTGGTFTDTIVITEAGELVASKLLCLPHDVGARVRGLLGDRTQVRRYRHATTVPTNALIEGRGAKVGLICTEGFRDVVEMRGQRRPPIYDTSWDRLPPLVPRYLRREVGERMRSDGAVERGLDADEVSALIEELADEGVAAVAVCLINSYENPQHESAIGAIAAVVAPELPICLSSAVFRDVGEYERTSTACVNAALIPLVDDYLTGLENDLLLEGQDLVVMGSHGGFIGARSVRTLPAQIIESGPAAGVLASWHLASELGIDGALCFDMGGTTAKAALVGEAEPMARPGLEVGGGATLANRLFGGEGHAVKVPTLDIAEVGAGGGSIAWIDAGRALRVGPEGARAHPGPACYGLGGEEPTVTDANVVLGYINPLAIAAGSVSIFADRAAQALHDRVGRNLGLSIREAALAVVKVADATMMRALRAVTIERGQDPRELTLIAYGGGGPLHAARLADLLGITRVVIPPLPGLFSALGLLLAGYRHDASRSVLLPADEGIADSLEEAYRQLEASVWQAIARDELTREQVTVVREADLQYRIGGAVLTVLAGTPTQSAPLDVIASRFRESYRRVYGFESESPVDVVAVRVRAQSAAEAMALATLGKDAPSDGGPELREMYFGGELGAMSVPVLLGREAVRGEVTGPLVVEEEDTTVLVPPGWQVARHESRVLHLTPQATEQR